MKRFALAVDGGETLRLLELEMFRGVGVHASHARHGGDDVGAVGEGDAGARCDVEVAGGVDDHVRPDGLRPFLGLDDDAGGAAVLHDGGLEPAMQAQGDAGLAHHVERSLLEAVGVEGGGEDDGVGLGLGMEVEHAPAGPLAPERFGRADDRIAVRLGRIHAEPPGVHAIDDLHGEAAHGDLHVVVHVVQHQHHAAGREAAEGSTRTVGAPLRAAETAAATPVGPPPTTTTPVVATTDHVGFGPGHEFRG